MNCRTNYHTDFSLNQAKPVLRQSSLMCIFSLYLDSLIVWHSFSELLTLREKCPNTEFFLACIFLYSDWILTDTLYLSLFSPNTGKYGPEKTLHLDTFHAVLMYSEYEVYLNLHFAGTLLFQNIYNGSNIRHGNLGDRNSAFALILPVVVTHGAEAIWEIFSKLLIF